MKLDYYSTSSLKKNIVRWILGNFFKNNTQCSCVGCKYFTNQNYDYGDVGSYFITHSMVTIFSLIAQFGLPQLIVS